MNTIYNEYMSDSERELAIIFAESDAQIAKLNVLMTSINGKLEANMLAAEAKVLAESGTYDDLISLYTEATTEANVEKEGAFQKLVNIIKNLIAKLKAFFTGRPIKDDEIPEQISVDKEMAGRMKTVDNSWTQFETGVNKLKNGDASGAWNIVKVVGTTLGAVLGGVVTTGAVVVWKRDQIKEWLQKYTDRINWLDGVINAMDKFVGKKATDTEDATGVLGIINKVVKTFSSWKAYIQSLFTKNPAETTPNAPKKSNKLTKSQKKQAITEYSQKNNITGKLTNEQLAEAYAEFKKTHGDTNTTDEVVETPVENAEEAPKTESAHLFDMDLDTDMFTESEMSDEEYSDLCDLFAEL